MSESATTTSRRERTSRTISECAQRLADLHGLDGFTMEQLAAAAGVSRRTVFNYFDGKLEAVVGEDLGDRGRHERLFEIFGRGGPNGELIADLRAAAVAVVASDDEDLDPQAIARSLRLLRREPRVLHVIHLRLEEACTQLAELIETREGPAFGAERARVLAKILISIFDLALDAFVEDPSVTLADHVGRTFDTVHDLLGRTS
ncbi:TetR/AcrR family transcriptional regulator [Nocardioides insulae]|uniref:TetR/AcrR family transcriptional regulator n=1 Tax=Nocardioides insulae TaxID=394734 RepID=UPI0012FB6917|nr:TetR/AcrR family transcriptional regulator [Nocardioides insulae]